MGDGADAALECAMDDCELFEELQGATNWQGLHDNGFMDEQGAVDTPVFLPLALTPSKPLKPFKLSGPGVCPVCGSSTHPVTNKTTKAIFYGCDNYPDCKGSRNG